MIIRNKISMPKMYIIQINKKYFLNLKKEDIFLTENPNYAFTSNYPNHIIKTLAETVKKHMKNKSLSFKIINRDMAINQYKIRDKE